MDRGEGDKINNESELTVLSLFVFFAANQRTEWNHKASGGQGIAKCLRQSDEGWVFYGVLKF
jgi:hypothetical protein